MHKNGALEGEPSVTAHALSSRALELDEQAEYIGMQIEFLKVGADDLSTRSWRDLEKWTYRVRPFFVEYFPLLSAEFDRIAATPDPAPTIGFERPGRLFDAEAARLNRRKEIRERFQTLIEFVSEEIAAALTRRGPAQEPVLDPKTHAELLSLKDSMDPQKVYLGESTETLSMFRRIYQLLEYPGAPILLLGPTGSGKSVIARVIHQASERKGKRKRESSVALKTMDFSFVLGHLVGYGKNSGIKGIPPEGRDGRLKECAGGTLFVDEITEATHQLQTLLFDVIDHEEVESPLGELQAYTPDIALIFATNRNPHLAVKHGSLKEDFVNRIEHRTIYVAPLRKRPLDIFPFLDRECGKLERDRAFVLALLEYRWPSNVRELVSVLRNAVAITRRRLKNPSLTLESLELRDMSVVRKIEQMDEREVKALLYRKLIKLAEEKQLTVNRGRNKFMAEVLKLSQSTVSEDLKALGRRA